MKIIIIVLLFYPGLILGQEFKLTDVSGSYYTIDRFANEVYYTSPWTGGLIQKINLITKEVEDTQLSGLPVFFHNTHQAIYLEITDSSNIYYLINFEIDTTKKLLELKFSSKNLLKTNFIFLPWHKISPDDKKLFLGNIFIIEDSTWITATESFFNYVEPESGFIWNSDSSVVFKSVENSLAEYNIYSQNIDTLVSLELDNPITGFDYSIQNKQVAYSTGEGFLHEKLFLYDKRTNTTKLVFDPNQSIPNYNCGGWAQFDNIVWSINGNYLAFLSYMYTNTGAGINIYDLLNDKTIIIEKCDHYGLKQNLTWVNADSILYRREDLDEIYGYNLHDKLTSLENNKPDIYQLTLSNYPNPFNPVTTIKYSLPNVASDVSLRNIKLTVYDILGREVATVVNEEYKPGIYELKFNATGLPSGMYFYRLETPEFTKTRKLLLIK